MNKKRIGAIVALILIAGLYASALVFALMDSPFARSCLMAALFCTIVGPIIIYAYLFVLRYFKSNRPDDDIPDKTKNSDATNK